MPLRVTIATIMNDLPNDRSNNMPATPADETGRPEEGRRCPSCDSRMPAGSDRCLMCGWESGPLRPVEAADSEGKGARRVEAEPAEEGQPPDDVSGEGSTDVEEPVTVSAALPSDGKAAGIRRPSAVFWMTAVTFLVTTVAGILIVRYGGPVQLALFPTVTPIRPTPSFTRTVTLPPTNTRPPTGTPTVTPPPSPTATPQPPRTHQVTAGETLFGLSLFYNVSMESIAALNGFDVETPIQSGQTLQVPWPTPTPPLEPMAIEINGETVIADPTNCEQYVIEEGDAISVIAARYNINFELLQQVNRLTERSVLQPGDTICIPEISYGGILPPTPGPSPTPSSTSFPPGPMLLYPPPGMVFDMSSEPIVLQWVAVKDLASDEWYMVEIVDESVQGAHPLRGFTRQNAFRVPERWRPHDEELHPFQWQVSIVRVTGQREDGGFIYTFGGRSSEERRFTWQGAVPTPTATPTMTPSPEAESG